MAMFYRAPFFGMPRPSGLASSEDPVAELMVRLREAEDPELVGWLPVLERGGPEVDVLRASLGHSPFLNRAALADLGYFRRLIEVGPDALFTEVILHIKDALASEADEARLARGLRVARRKAALAVAFADLTDHWSLERVTHALSDLADAALSAALCHLLLAAHARNEIVLADPNFPEDGCGYVILAMGKYGARELNYSSDIDLIALYEPTRVDYRGSRSVQQFFIGLTQRLGRLINDRIGDGYVFRVDWRLRPDPGATQLAISFGSARAYYAERGETWERAAMIKARPASGDIALGRAFLSELSTFVWPERMDFWALREIRRLKQRINEHRGGADIDFLGHNIKIGRGGIREIEFYAQTQQLVYGATDPYLRCQKTLDALSTLSEAGYVDEAVADELTEAYEFLRQLEHRLQMVNDQQTQTLPADADEMARLAGFMGFEDADALRDVLYRHLHRVACHYQALFDAVDHDDDAGVWSLSGATPSAQLTAALMDAGFADPSAVHAVFRRWAAPNGAGIEDDRRAQALASLVPRVVEAARKHAAKDPLVAALDRLITALDRDAASLALLASSPKVLDIVLTAAARAPALLRAIEARPTLLQHLVEREITLRPPGRELLLREVMSILGHRGGVEERRAGLAALAARVRLQLGVATLGHAMTAVDVGHASADLFDALMIGAAKAEVAASGASDFALVATGRLGAREATALDLAELMLLVDGDRTVAERLGGGLAACALALDGWAGPADAQSDRRGGPLIVAVHELRDGPIDDRALRLLPRVISARPLAAPNGGLTYALSATIGRLVEAATVREGLMRPLAARRQALLDGAVDAERLIDDPAGAPGGLDDIRLLTMTARLLAAARSGDGFELSVPAALERLEGCGVISASVGRSLRRTYFELRQIENYRWFALAGEPPSDALRAEFDMALATAIGVEDRADLAKSMHAALAAVGAGFAEVIKRLSGA